MWRILRYTPEGWADDSRGGAVGVTRGFYSVCRGHPLGDDCVDDAYYLSVGYSSGIARYALILYLCEIFVLSLRQNKMI